MLIICIDEDKEKLKTAEEKIRALGEDAEIVCFSDSRYAKKCIWDQYNSDILADVRTFGNFDVFVMGEAVSFKRSKSKELLAYLIDRQGGGVTRPEAFAVLWEKGIYDRSMQKQLDVIIRSLRSTLKEHGIEGILEMRGGIMRIRTERVNCDLYNLLRGDETAQAEYHGEYMSSYSWGNLTEAYMTRTLEKE